MSEPLPGALLQGDDVVVAGRLEGVHTRADAHVGDVPDFVSQDAEATLVGIVVEQSEPQILGRLERYLVSVDDEREEIEALRNTDQRPLVEAHGPFEGLLKCRQHASEGGLEAGAVNGGEIMYRRGGVKMYHGLGGSLSA